MASTLETLVVRLTADATKLEQELNQQVRKSETAGQRIARAFTAATRNFAALGAAATGAATAMTLAANRAASYADEVDKAAIRTRLARSTVQELRFVADQAGGSFQAIEQNIRAFTGRIAEAERGSKTLTTTFDRLGVSLRDNQGNLRDTEDLFLDTLTALSQVENETERASLAVSAFGETASELLPIIGQGAGGIEALRQKARDLGLVLSDQGIRSLVEYKDAVSALRQQFDAVQRELAIAFVPVLQNQVLPLIEGALGLFRAMPGPLQQAAGSAAAAATGFGAMAVAARALGFSLSPVFGPAGVIVAGAAAMAQLAGATIAATNALNEYANAGIQVGGLSDEAAGLMEAAMALEAARGDFVAQQSERVRLGEIDSGEAEAAIARYDARIQDLRDRFGEVVREAAKVRDEANALGNTDVNVKVTVDVQGAAALGAVADSLAAIRAVNIGREDEGVFPRTRTGSNLRAFLARDLGINPFATVNGAVPLGDPGVRATFGGVADLRGFAPRATVGGAVRLDDPGAFARLLLGGPELQERDLGRLAAANQAAIDRAKEEAEAAAVAFALARIEATTAALRQGEDAGTIGRVAFGPFTTGQQRLNDSYQGFVPRRDNPADLANAAKINEERAEDLRRAGEEFRASVVEAGVTFAADLASAIKSGDPGSIFGAASSGIGSVLGLFNPLAGTLFGLFGGLAAGLIPGRDRQESEATRALGASTRGAPAIEFNMTVNQSLSIASLTGEGRRAVDGLLNDTASRLEAVITRNVLPRLGYLEERIA